MKHSKNTENKFSLDTTISIRTAKNKKLTDSEKMTWLENDAIEDTIPGISLKKAYKFLEQREPKDTIIVAVLDSPVDIEHEDFKGQIWVNKDEVPDNNIDDDANGYIDDINGWNFLGDNQGKQDTFFLYESTRILKKYQELFGGMTKDKDKIENPRLFELYSTAKKRHEIETKEAIEDTAYANMLIDISKNARKTLSFYFPEHEYTLESLDSLKKVYPKDTLLQVDILRMSNFIKYNFTEKYIHDYKLKADAKINKLLNLEYNDRLTRGDDPENPFDYNYGNGIVNQNIDFYSHGTIVSGVIGARRNNNLGIDGVAKVIKLMPVCISAFGEEHDKDLALGIRYAVDNGARVINMSIGKKLSMNKKWVDEAIQYAEKKNVLVVSSAGNEHRELNGTNEYPTDSREDSTEISHNFIHVGASSYMMNEKLVAPFSNYSKSFVDIFAPGSEIYTLHPHNKYVFDSGTSLSAAVVSGVAALIMIYYPELSGSQVKEILMKSGTSYSFNTEIKQRDGTKKTVSFSELSKSGKVINAYNALLMAESISQQHEVGKEINSR
ncbi:S8 family peptidase [Aquimarina celericrescens]|uniref:S8 family peptidase n=1 Tax=Aquimarina celericrescens TaxID=1964542 RepID=A0ABW5AVE1_9FLAO